MCLQHAVLSSHSVIGSCYSIIRINHPLRAMRYKHQQPLCAVRRQFSTISPLTKVKGEMGHLPFSLANYSIVCAAITFTIQNFIAQTQRNLSFFNFVAAINDSVFHCNKKKNVCMSNGIVIGNEHGCKI